MIEPYINLEIAIKKKMFYKLGVNEKGTLYKKDFISYFYISGSKETE